MSEFTKKKKANNKWNAEVISALQKKYGLTLRFIHMSITGERVSVTSLKIKEDYKSMLAALKKTMQKEINK